MTTTLRILGVPAPQGSHTRMPNGAMVEASSATGRRKHKDWRAAVKDAAQTALAERGEPYAGAVVVHVEFRLPMPKSRPAAVRAAGWGWAPRKPDLDKLCRALGDGLVAGGLLVDDALIVRWGAYKCEVWGDWTGALVTVGGIWPCNDMHRTIKRDGT